METIRQTCKTAVRSTTHETDEGSKVVEKSRD